MSIRVQCGHCGIKRKVNERLAGRTIRCPNCEKPFTIPKPPVVVEAEPVLEAEPVRKTQPIPIAEPVNDAPVEGKAVDDGDEATKGDFVMADDVVEEGAGDSPGPTDPGPTDTVLSTEPEEFSFDDEPASAVANVYAATQHESGPGNRSATHDGNGTDNAAAGRAAVDRDGSSRVAAQDIAAKKITAQDAVPANRMAAAFKTSGGTAVLEHPDTQSEVDDDMDEGIPPRKKREDGELDMTPMVDVTFLLLIFFMVTASFSLQKSIQVPRQSSDLPSMSNVEEETEELDPIELEIDETGAFLVLAPEWERETPGKQNLVNALKQAIGDNRDGMRLDVKIHENAKLQMLVDGMDAGTIAGFTEIQVTEVDGFD